MSDGSTEPMGTADTRRLDRWLWFARVVKSRTLAATLVEAGKVRINRLKVTKPSYAVKPGDVLTIILGPRVRILKIEAIGARRGPATEAQTLFEDLSPPMAPPTSAENTAGKVDRTPGSGRPTKRERRVTDRLKGDLS